MGGQRRDEVLELFKLSEPGTLGNADNGVLSSVSPVIGPAKNWSNGSSGRPFEFDCVSP